MSQTPSTEVGLKHQINEAMKTAMRSQDKESLGTIRLILSALKQVEVDERIVLDDTRILAIMDKMLKQRRESIEQFKQANRQDLVDKEQKEIEVIQKFMPKPLSMDEINAQIELAMKSSDAKTIQDMGKVMAILKPILQGKADMAQVGALVRKRLS